MIIPPDIDDRYVELAPESVLLRVADHVGVFYRGDAERDGFVVPLVAAALAADFGVVYVCDGRTPGKVAARLGAEVEDAMAREQVRIVSSEEVYLAGDRFDPDHTVGFYSGELRHSRRCCATTRSAEPGSWRRSAASSVARGIRRRPRSWRSTRRRSSTGWVASGTSSGWTWRTRRPGSTSSSPCD
ncbi:MAG: MEDS domain-containing protein [Pseudonocardia sp.]